jgi:hypothetical protein
MRADSKKMSLVDAAMEQMADAMNTLLWEHTLNSGVIKLSQTHSGEIQVFFKFCF